jgi:hypothetical protein
MSVAFYGDYDTTETVNIPFNTFSSDNPSASVTVSDLVAADIEIHKDGSTTQRASDNGVTVSINFDSVTGNHMVHIDLSDNSDAGYYANGSRYAVRIEGATVDGGTINAWVGAFSIGCTLRPTTAGAKLDVSATGEAGLDFDNINDATGAHTLTNITVPVVTDVSNEVTADVTKISGDSDAANNLELALENGTAGYIASDMKYLDGGAQSATDLKDFADAGYDPGTNKVQGVVLTDTCTTNTDMRGTDGANTTVPDAAGTAAALHTTTDGKIDVVDGIVDDILVDTAEIGAAGIGLTAIPWNSDWDVEVNSQVSDVLKTDTIAEMTQGIPPTTPTFQQAIMYGYMALTKDLNDDGSSKDFYNNAGTVIWKKALSDDGTDYHETKGASGA